MSENFAVVEYENAMVEFNGDKDEAILERMVSNPIHVYNVIRDMEYFVSEILPLLLILNQRENSGDLQQQNLNSHSTDPLRHD